MSYCNPILSIKFRNWNALKSKPFAQLRNTATKTRLLDHLTCVGACDLRPFSKTSHINSTLLKYKHWLPEPSRTYVTTDDDHGIVNTWRSHGIWTTHPTVGRRKEEKTFFHLQKSQINSPRCCCNKCTRTQERDKMSQHQQSISMHY